MSDDLNAEDGSIDQEEVDGVGSRSPNEREAKRQHQNEIIVAAKAAGRTDREAADLAGLSERSLRRRRAEDPEFAEAMARARDARVSILTDRLVHLAERAATVLADVLEHDDARLQLRAIDLSLREGYRLHNGDVHDRFDKLEARLERFLEAHQADNEAEAER